MQTKPDVEQMLMQSLKELVLVIPLEKITIKEITDKAQVIRPTFYNHFQDKYELLEWIVREDLMEPAMPLFDNGLLREGITYLFTAMEKERDFYEKAVRLEGQNSFQEIFVRCIRQEVEQALRENAFHPSYHLLSVELISEYFARIFWFVTEKWLNYAEEVSALEVMEVYEILFSDSAEKLLGHKVEG